MDALLTAARDATPSLTSSVMRVARRALGWRVPTALLVLLIALAVLAPWIAPYALAQPDGYERMLNLAPSLAHPFGTDDLGRDVLTRMLFGARVSLAVAMSAALLSLALGATYGVLAGMLGGRFDRWMMRALDVAISIPRLLLLLAVSAFSDGAPSLIMFIALLGATGWFDVARLVRGDVQALMRRDFVLAAHNVGVGPVRLAVKHLVPHLLPALAISTTLNVANTITLEAGLSFLGFGVQPPTPSWGNILMADSGALGVHWWMAFFPAVATITTVVACYVLGDALREVFALDQVPA